MPRRIPIIKLLANDNIVAPAGPRILGPRIGGKQFRPPFTHTINAPFRVAHIEQLMVDLANWAVSVGFIKRYDLNARLGPGLYGETTNNHAPGPRSGLMSIDASWPSEDRLRVVYHELAHAVGFNLTQAIFFSGGTLRESVSHNGMEVGAEMCAFVAMANLGYDTKGFSFPYMTAYATGQTGSRKGADKGVLTSKAFAIHMVRVVRTLTDATDTILAER
jgi:hypothetical protein